MNKKISFNPGDGIGRGNSSIFSAAQEQTVKLFFPWKLVALLLSLAALYMMLYLMGVIKHNAWDDRQIFEFIGWSVANGTSLYDGIWDHKGPIIFLFNALAYKIVPSSDIGIELLCALTFSSAILFLYLAYRYCMPMRGAASLTFACAVWDMSFIGNANWNSIESLYFFFSSIGLYLLVRIVKFDSPHRLSCVVVGLLSSFSVLTKPNLAGLACFALCILIGEGYVRQKYTRAAWNIACFCAGVVSGLVLIVVPFMLKGTFDDLMDGMLYFNLFEYDIAQERFYTALDSFIHLNIPIPAWAKNSFILKLICAEFVHMLAFMVMCGSLFLIFGCALVKRLDKGMSAPVRLLWLGLLMWLLLEIGAAGVKTGIFKHYYAHLCIPAFLLVGMAFPLFRHKWWKIIMGVMMAAQLALFAIFAFRNIVFVEKFGSPQVCSVLLELNPEKNAVPVYGGTLSCLVLRECRMKTNVKYCINAINYACSKSERRRAAIEKDLLDALRTNRSSVFLSMGPIENAPFTSPELLEEISHYTLRHSDNPFFVYTKKTE